MDFTPIKHSKPRRDALVTFSDGTILAAPVETRLEAYVAAWHAEHGGDRPLAAIINRELRELTIPVRYDMNIETLLTLRHSDGGRIYRRSLSFLMTTAAAELFPEAQVIVDHSLPTGAYYCHLIGRPRLNEEELARLDARMREIVAADEPITRREVPLEEAIAYFREHGYEDKLRLMDMRDKKYLILYTLRGNSDYFYGYMVPATGYLQTFALRMYPPDGFLLMYPRQENPQVIQPYEASEKIAAVFERQNQWLRLLGVDDIGALNQAIKNGGARELILVAEALHDQHIAEIATQIARRHQTGARLVLIAGPTSSGKTTFSKRLAVQLMAHGLKPYPLALDHYFVDREETPLDAEGKYDFEALEALNLPLLNRQLLDLMRGEEVRLPHFDFVSGKSGPGDTVQLTADHILIVEGIHGLNPALVPDVPEEMIYRVYVSALTQLNIDLHNRIPTTDVRLLRRIVRDATTRGYTALDTLQRWPSVRRGEKQHIFPYQENANVMFNTGLVYELAVLRPLAEPLLRQIGRGEDGYQEAKRLLAFLSWVRPMPKEPAKFVPHDSLLREFIGDSILDDYMPGERSNPAAGGAG